MKIFTIIALLFIGISAGSQTTSDLVGTWKLKTVLDASGKKCPEVAKYKLTLFSDSTYLMDSGRSFGVFGYWTLVDNTIKFDARTIADPCLEWKVDKEFKSFELREGVLIIDMFICGTVDGTSYFTKMKREYRRNYWKWCFSAMD